MYLKLALKNMKQSTKDYLIYMITLVLSVAMFYGFFSIVSPYYSNMLPISIHMEILNKAMRIAVPAVGILILFLVSYVNRYMLKRKQKEFALQTIIGMEQRTVAWIFFLENLMIGALALILGILSGTILSQLINAVVLKAFKQEFIINSFPVMCVMNWTSGLMMDNLQKDNLLPEAYAIVPTTCHTIFILAITVILSLWLIIRFYKKWTR